MKMNNDKNTPSLTHPHPMRIEQFVCWLIAEEASVAIDDVLSMDAAIDELIMAREGIGIWLVKLGYEIKQQ